MSRISIWNVLAFDSMLSLVFILEKRRFSSGKEAYEAGTKLPICPINRSTIVLHISVVLPIDDYTFFKKIVLQR